MAWRSLTRHKMRLSCWLAEEGVCSFFLVLKKIETETIVIMMNPTIPITTCIITFVL
ncbi:hypothetical protein Hanom_Chr04g00312641 [Helianthus anomalus]